MLVPERLGVPGGDGEFGRRGRHNWLDRCDLIGLIERCRHKAGLHEEREHRRGGLVVRFRLGRILGGVRARFLISRGIRLRGRNLRVRIVVV